MGRGREYTSRRINRLQHAGVIFVHAWLTSSDRQLTDSVIACMGDEFLLVCTCGSGRWVGLGRHHAPVRSSAETNQTLVSQVSGRLTLMTMRLSEGWGTW